VRALRPTTWGLLFVSAGLAVTATPGGELSAQDEGPCPEEPLALIFQVRNTGQTPEPFAALPPSPDPGLPPLIAAPPGRIDVHAAIVSDLTGGGVQGWLLTLDVRGDIRLLGTRTEGTVADLAALGPPGIRQELSFERTMLLAPGEEGLQQGVASHTALSFDGSTKLDPTGTATVLILTLEGEDGDSGELLWFGDTGVEEGRGASLMPMENLATVDGKDRPFCEVSARVSFDASLAGGRRLPGDSNEDGVLDISDAVAVFGVLFLGRPERFPCGDGTRSDPGNAALIDWQPDGAVDISDGISILSFLFAGGPPHPLAVPGMERQACIPVAGCSDSAPCAGE
jgi:hypothetical protein